MSNGEDVLDNWEEIDEAGLTNTLQKIKEERKKASTSNKTPISGETYLRDNPTNISDNRIEFTQLRNSFQEQPMMKLLQRSASSSSGGFGDPISDSLDNTVVPDSPKSPLDDMSSAFQPVMMLLHKPSDEYQSANYTQPMQAVKILRRPTQNVERRNNDQRPKAPLKTLKQREQEYAEARLRILGSAKNPEDDKTIDSNASNSTPSTGTITTGITGTTVVVSNSASNATVKKPTSLNQSPSNAQTSVLITSTPVRMKAAINSGQKMKPLPLETLNIKNHFYPPQQQMLQQTNFFPHQQQSPFLQHQILQFSNALNNSRITIPVVGAPTTHPLQQPKNSPNLVHSNIANTNHRNHHHFQKQTNHQIAQQNNKPGSWSPSRNSMRGQQQDNVLRMPRGPDGSVGFQMRR